MSLTHKQLYKQCLRLLIQANSPQSVEQIDTIPNSITIVCEANDEGYLLNELPNKEALHKLPMYDDSRAIAILCDMPTELGLYTWPIVYHNETTHTIKTLNLKVWIVPQ